MTRRRRQGWRLPSVTVQLAVAGFLSITGTPFITESGTVFAQADDEGRSKPPPPAPAQPPPAPRKPQPLEPVARAPLNPPLAPAHEEPEADPTQTAVPTAAETSPLLLVLPTPPSLERLAVRRNSLNQVLFRDRRHQLLLTRGDAALSDDDERAAVDHFQALVDATYDAFIWPNDSAHPLGSQVYVEQRLKVLNENGRSHYERRHGDEARALLTEGVETANDPLILQVLRRFPHTDAGREALTRQLLSAHDMGLAARSAHLAQRLADDPHHWRQLSPRVQSIARRALERQSPSCGPTSAGNVARLSPPALRPSWSYEFSNCLHAEAEKESTQSISVDVGAAPSARTARAAIYQLADTVEESLRDWQTEREDRRFPVATANQAFVFDDLLVVRDYAGVGAMRLSDGQPQWSFHCVGSLAAVAAENLREVNRGGGPLPLSYQAHFAGHGPRGQLCSDGRLVFLVDDDLPASSPQRSEDVRTNKQPPYTNRLVALRLHSESAHSDPVWTQPSQDGDEALAGHFFLGAPLEIDGRLFILSERDSRIECISMDAADGRVVWRQPIALTEQPIDADSGRLRIAHTPTYAASTIVCPTEVGVIVGVDPLTGVLRWVYDHFDDDQRQAAGRWSSNSQRQYGSTELPSRTLVRNGRVVHLPFRSQYVHCLDAATGEPVWKVERDGALALSAASDQFVLLIGPREVTALSLVDGSVSWRTPCPEPAGHGVVAEGCFLLPITDGRCLSLSLDDGELRGGRFGKLLHELAAPVVPKPSPAAPVIQLASHEVLRPVETTRTWLAAGGNLTVAEGVIVVTTPTHVSVFPQARAMLETLSDESLLGRLSADDQLHAAMLHLVLDDRLTARRRLEELLADRIAEAVHVSGPESDVRRRATRLLRELLFAELNDTRDSRSVLDQIEQLPGDECDHLRLLVSRIEIENQLCGAEQLIAAIDELRRLDASVMISPGGDADYFVRAADLVADQLAAILAEGRPELSSSLESYVAEAVADARQSADVAEQEQLLRLFDAFPQVAGIRNDFAQACIVAGRLQQAELLLLRNRESASQLAATDARRMLVELYASHALYHEAASILQELIDDASDADGVSEWSFAQQLASGHPIRQIVRRRVGASLPAHHVRITEHICDDDCGAAVACQSLRALEQHDRIRRKFLVNDNSSITIIDKGITSGDRSQSQLSLINRETGDLSGQIEVPSAYWQLAAAGEGYCGQLLPICGRSAHGLSLLEKRAVWSTTEPGEDPPRDKVKVGPIGRDYCVLQTTRTLSVVHPATGAVRWSRDDLSPCIGLMGNEGTGIIGDDETLTMFDADQIGFTVYRMKTGREVRTGRLDLSPVDARRHRRTVGRMLVYLASDDVGDRLRIWDSVTDRTLLDVPLRDRLFSAIGNGREYAFIDRTGDLKIVDVLSGEVRVRLSLSEETLSDVGDLNVTSDPDRYYVDLVGCHDNDVTEAVAAMDEVELPRMRVQGQLVAVSRQGELEWSRPVEEAALLTHTQCSLPILTLISRAHDPHDRQSTRLSVEVLDVRTGQTLSRNDDLLRTRIVQADHRARPGCLRLIGLDSQICIEYAVPAPEMLIHAEIAPEATTR